METVDQMSRQEVFTKACDHLMTQWERAADSDYNCAYRLQKDERTLACAAGGLMTDEAHAQVLTRASWLNNAGVSNQSAQLCLIMSGVSAFDMDLVKHLQFTHDTNEPSDWPILLSLIAAIHDLQVPSSVYKRLEERNAKK